MTITVPRLSETYSKLDTDFPRGCGCPACQNGSNGYHEDNGPLYDLAVLPGGGGTVTPSSIGLNNAGELLSGNEWGPGGGVAASITYSFLESVPPYYVSNAQERMNFESFTEEMKEAVRAIADMIETFANVTLTEVSGIGDITYGQAWLTSTNSDPGAWGYYPDQGSYSGDVWTNTKYAASTQNVDVGTYGFFTLMHETGHALGLQHSFTAGLTGAENTEQFTVMAYDWSPWGSAQYAESYMLYDIAALQEIYGANMTYHQGDNLYTISDSSPQTIWDAGGSDTINTAGVASDVVIHLEAGGFSSIGDTNTLAIAYGAVIEKAVTGSGDDILYGNSANNTLNGGAGADSYYGQAGNDTYVFTSGQDAVTETTGTDTVSFASTWDPGDVSITGDLLTLLSSVNQISFNDIHLIEFFSFAGYAAMTLDELLAFGAPVMTDDLFIGTSAAEIFDGGDGIDTVDYSNSTDGINLDLLKGKATAGFATGDTLISIENVHGSDFSGERDTIYGNEYNNSIYGLAGNDILEGDGGADTIDGGAGFDYARYTRSTSGVHVDLETNSNTGGDAQGDQLHNIEALTGSNYNDFLRGDSDNNYLRGEKGDDQLYAGAGFDQLHGGVGADVFILQASSGPTDKILDFSLSQGDKIDVSDILSGYDPFTDVLSDFVQITDSGLNSLLAVDANGGGDHFVSVALVLNVAGLTDEDALAASGTLITV